MIKKRVYYISEKNVHLVRLIGSFMFFGAVLMVLYSTAMLFEDWEALKRYDRCSSMTIEVSRQECIESFYRVTGVYPTGYTLNLKQKFMVFIKPIAMLLFWSIVFFAGLLLYGCKKISLTFYEIERESLLHSKPKLKEEAKQRMQEKTEEKKQEGKK
ncbi:MAG: hypothetical protein QXM75_04120 [Candidatus Diapherotrites archaeon]